MSFLLITIPESDICLVDKQDWIDLQDADKNRHIQNASYYVATSWVCEEVDWNDENLVLDDDVICSIANYSYHDFQGTLYNTEGTSDDNNVKMQTLKAGSLDGSVEYFTKGSSYARFAPIDAVFKAHSCKRVNSGTRDLVRN